jgi:uncharacterized protein (TIGR02996 family)
MNTQEALLQAIWNDPDDDTPRLVYADFLEETGKDADVARAKLIRLGIETAKLDPIGKYLSPLVAEEKRLWKKYRNRWMAGLPRWACHSPAERGFLRDASCTLHQFFKDAEAIFDREPLIELNPTGSSREQAKQLADSSILERLRFLTFSGHLDDRLQAILLGSPYLKNLWELKIWRNARTEDWIPLIAREPKFSMLRRLHFYLQSIGIAGVTALSQSTTLRELKSFELFGDASDETARLLATSPIMNKVKSFRFTGEGPFSALTSKGFRVLTGSSWMDHLQSLDLTANRITDDGLKNLPPSLTWQQLEDLDLSNNQISDNGLQFLSKKSLPKIKILKLQDNPIAGRGLADLFQSSVGRSLEQLFVGHCSIDDEGLLSLAQSATSGPLLFLRLWNNPFTGKGLKALMDSPLVENLRFLELNSVPIGDLGAMAIAKSPYLIKLDTLQLEDCQITDKGLIALAGSANCTSLRTLTLSSNRFTREGIRAFAQSPFMKNLTGLSMIDTQLNDPCALALAESPYLKTGYFFNLSMNHFSLKAIDALKKRFKHIIV